MVKTVNALTAKHWLDAGNAVLVDVREPAEYAAASIAGATLIPIGTISRKALPDVTDKKLVIHCHSGVRSANACELLQAQDPKLDAYNLEGGIVAWGQAGLPLINKGIPS